MQEVYIHESNLSYGWLGQHGAAIAPKLNTEVPGILNKTVYGLYISQGGFVADNNTNVGYWGHLDEQFHQIRNDSSASTMPGVMAWVLSRSEKSVTPDYFAKLVDHYYTQGNTSYFGDGNNTQLISNPQFDPNTSGWTLTPGSGGTVGQFNYSSVSFDNDHDDHAQASHGTYGLKMVRGSSRNEASFEVSGLDTDMYYTVSAWVIAETAGQSARLAITESDGTYIDSMEIDTVGSAPDYYWKWNEWSRIIFNFVPTSDTIDIVLSDWPASPGTTLYWDFIELEEAYLVPEPATLGLLLLGGLTLLRRRRK
ncbi:MAG: PEP-CTERM sorting domain-containing protein [Phycisphaerae bacterium]|nr:PEP-CTERM sorting domain-containing protein [Phycisphaerae bacterium]